MGTTTVDLAGGWATTTTFGAGAPVLFIQTALLADELVPIATAESLQGYRRIVAHRRGYAASSPARADWSVRDEARDCRDLLHGLDIARAHVVGLSYAGAIALQLATVEPSMVGTLTLVEPPPAHVRSADEFRAANAELLQVRREHGPAVALDRFLTRLTGPDWRVVMDRQLPGAVTQMERDAATFFDVDVPALLAWQYDAADAADVDCPVLYVGASDSGEWFAEVRAQVLTWLPHADDVMIEGADHTLALTHPRQVADALADFLAQHPLAGG